jgi:hypothetical protein
VPHSPLKRHAQHRAAFKREHLHGLEYLMPSSAKTKMLDAVVTFPRIHIDAQLRVSRPLDGVQDVFLVQRLADYVYSYIIDIALMGTRRDPRFPPTMLDQRQRYRSHRMATHLSCAVKHQEPEEEARLCPLEWVLYTKQSSDFYTACRRLVAANGSVNYDLNRRYMNVTPVSYHLVSFLCGPFCDDTSAQQHVQGHDQWVIVPLYFIDLWNALSGGGGATQEKK